MLQLLYPLGLLAAIGILVPVLVHLWNIKSGKTLKIGSISLLGAASNQRSTHLKVSDWPLLLIRCLLLLLLAVLLAQPLYRSEQKAAQPAGWILLEKQSLGKAWKNKRKEMDFLLKKGYEIHDFNTGFSKLELKDTSTVFSLPAAVPLSYYSLIRQLNAERQQGTKIYLYTANRLNRFEGDQPDHHLNLNWKFFSSEQSDLDTPASTSDQDAQAKGKKKLTGTDSSSLTVMIFSNGQLMDAPYVRAAVNAIADFSKRKLLIRDIQSLQQIKQPVNIVFWLSDQSLSAAQLKKLPDGILFFSYAGKKTEKLKSVIHYQPGSAAQEIALYQRKIIQQDQGKAIWRDGFGTPLLTLDSSLAIRHYQFYSRLNQGWTDLVWSNGLVDALLPLVIPHQEAEFGFPETQLAAQTVSDVPALRTIPVALKPAAEKASAVLSADQPLSAPFWWLLFIVFFIERWITYRKMEKKA